MRCVAVVALDVATALPIVAVRAWHGVDDKLLEGEFSGVLDGLLCPAEFSVEGFPDGAQPVADVTATEARLTSSDAE